MCEGEAHISRKFCRLPLSSLPSSISPTYLQTFRTSLLPPFSPKSRTSDIGSQRSPSWQSFDCSLCLLRSDVGRQKWKLNFSAFLQLLKPTSLTSPTSLTTSQPQKQAWRGTKFLINLARRKKRLYSFIRRIQRKNRSPGGVVRGGGEERGRGRRRKGKGGSDRMDKEKRKLRTRVRWTSSSVSDFLFLEKNEKTGRREERRKFLSSVFLGTCEEPVWTSLRTCLDWFVSLHQ